MKDNWTDFERYVFHELNKISARLAHLEGRSKVWGALAGALVAGVIEFIAKKTGN